MINWFLSLFFLSLQGPLSGFAMEMMLTPKQNRFTRSGRICCFGICYFLYALVKLLVKAIVQDPAISMMYSLTSIGLTILLIVALYKDPVWKRLLAFFLLYLAITFGELAYFLLPAAYTQDGLSMDYTQPDMMLGHFLGMVFASVGVMLMVLFWRRFQSKRIPRFIWIYLILPPCFGIPSVQEFVVAVENGGVVHWASMFALLTASILTLLLIFFMFRRAEQEGIEQELEQMKLQTALEQQHYQNIENRREEMAMIRHDYNNLLTSILSLVRMGRKPEAETALRELLQRVEHTREAPPEKEDTT